MVIMNIRDRLRDDEFVNHLFVEKLHTGSRASRSGPYHDFSVVEECTLNPSGRLACLICQCSGTTLCDRGSETPLCSYYLRSHPPSGLRQGGRLRVPRVSPQALLVCVRIVRSVPAFPPAPVILAVWPYAWLIRGKENSR